MRMTTHASLRPSTQRPQPAVRSPSVASAAALPERSAACSCGGGCPRCRMPRLLDTRAQAESSGQAPGDPSGDRYEREADRLADAALRSAHPARLKESVTPRQRPAAQPEPLADDEPNPQPGPIATLGAGEPLPPSQRAFFETRFGTDLGAVRLHRGTAAAEAAQHMSARAFTLGRDIVFDDAHFAPATRAGRHLLAHELVHTLQQRGSGGGAGGLHDAAAAPHVQRSAVAHFVRAGFEERAQVKRDEFEQTLPYETFLVKLFGTRKRRLKKFDERMDLLNPATFAQMRDDLSTEFGDKPKKLARKLAALDKRRERAAKKIGDLPTFGNILEIAATYHYVESQTLPDGEVYTFNQSVLDAVKAKFRSGQVWTDLEWKGKKIGVRFDIRFQKEQSAAAVQKVTGANFGHSRMVGEQLMAPAARTKDYDYTQDPPVVPPPTRDTLGEAFHSEIAVDTEAVRKEKLRLEYFYRESYRAEGRAPKQDVRSPAGEELDRYIASVIAHEIGHNIGMIHDDKGIMADQISQVTHLQEQVSDPSGKGTASDIINHIKVSYPDNPVTPANIQRLLDRIPDMTQKEMSYWADEIQANSFADPPSPDSGITVLRGPGPT